MTTDQPELALPGMPTRLFVASPTRLTTFSDCPRRYRMNYLERPTPPPGPPWAHLSFGASVHQALRGWYDLPAGGRTASAGAALVRARLDHRGLPGPRAERRLSGARRRDGRVVRRRTGPGRRARRRRTDGGPAHPDDGGQRTDRPPRRAGRSRRTPRAGGRRLQDGAGAAHAATTRADRSHWRSTPSPRSAPCAGRVAPSSCTTCRAAPWRPGPTPRLPCSGTLRGPRTSRLMPHRWTRRGGTASRTGPEEWDEVFPPRPGNQCGWCERSRHCPEGRTASPPKSSWAGLPDPDALS